MYNLEWDLSGLFGDNDAFYFEIDHLNKKIADLKRFYEIDFNADSLLSALNEMQYIKGKTRYILIYGSLRYYGNVNDKQCTDLKEIAEKFNNKVQQELKFIDNKIVELGEIQINEFINQNEDLKPFKHYIDNVFRLRSHLKTDDINKLIREKSNIISDSLKEYNELLRDMDYGIIFDGNKEVQITSSNFAKFAASRDRNVRRDANLTVNKAFANKENEFAEILHSIIAARVEISDLEGYKSVLEKNLFEENINPQIIESLIKSINDNLKLIQRYLKLKTDYIGVSDPHLYDLNVPFDSDLKIKYSLEDAVNIIKNALKPLGSEYISIVEHLLSNGHFDAKPNDNKHQMIIFSWFVYAFMNFRGTYGDLVNMIHELGHITNHYLSHQKQPYLYEDSTTFVGETASIINEMLLAQYLYENAQTEEEKLFYLSKKVNNFFTSVFRSTMFTEYENELYKMVSNGEVLSPEVLNQSFLEIMKKYYGESFVYDEEASIEWARTGQLFRWSYNRYKYATGLLIASSVVNSLLNEKTLSLDKYLEFLSKGSSEYPLDLLRCLNIDLTNVDIINKGLNILSDDIDELEKVLTKTKKGDK